MTDRAGHLHIAAEPDPAELASSRARAQLASSGSKPESGEIAERASEPDSERASTDALPAEFVAIVRPLEIAQRSYLRDPGLGACLRAFEEEPDGFKACADDALSRWKKGKSYKPGGLLCQMVFKGDHRRPPPVFIPAQVEPHGAVDDCIRCRRLLPIDTETLLCAACTEASEATA